jgi:spore coat protein H
MDPTLAASFDRQAFSNDTQPVIFEAEGRSFEGALLRHRGSWARTWPKKPLKIFFKSDEPFGGQHCLNLNSAWRDPAFVREVLAYEVYAACGVPSPEARVVQLQVNGAFHGLYVQVEQPDKPFLTRCQLKGASLFKASSQANQSDERDLGPAEAYSQHYEKQNHKAEGYGELQEFCHALAETTNAAAFFEARVDIDRYVNYLAATALVQNWDSFNKNHYLVHDVRGSGKWLVVPWDLDRTFGDHWDWSFRRTDLSVLLGTHAHRGVTGWNRMAERFLSEPALRRRFLDRLQVLLDTVFTPARLFPILDRLEASIGDLCALDRQRWPGNAGDLALGIQGVKQYIEQRREFLKPEISALR